MQQRMAEIFLHLKSKQTEIGGITKNYRHINMMFIVHFDTHRHVDEPWDATSYTNFGHKRKLLHLVFEKFHHIIVSGGIFDVI